MSCPQQTRLSVWTAKELNVVSVPAAQMGVASTAGRVKEMKVLLGPLVAAGCGGRRLEVRTSLAQVQARVDHVVSQNLVALGLLLD